MICKRQIYFCLIVLMMAMTAFGQSTQKVWTLEDCINYAWENNLTIRTNQLNQLQNEIALKESKFSRLPNLSGSGNVGQQFGRTINPNTNEFTSSDVIGGSMSLNSSLPVYRGGQINNTIRQNELNLKASEYDLQQSKNDIGLSVATSFLNVLLNSEQLENARFQLRVTQEQLDRTVKLVEAGSLPLVNKLDLESQVASNEVQVVNAENALGISILNLKQAMQMPADEELEIEIPQVEVSQITAKH